MALPLAAELGDFQTLLSILIGVNLASPVFLGLAPALAAEVSAARQEERAAYARLRQIMGEADSRRAAMLSQREQAGERVDHLLAAEQVMRNLDRKMDANDEQTDAMIAANAARAARLQSQLPAQFPLFFAAACLQLLGLLAVSIWAKQPADVILSAMLLAFAALTSVPVLRVLLSYVHLLRGAAKHAEFLRWCADEHIRLAQTLASPSPPADDLGAPSGGGGPGRGP